MSALSLTKKGKKEPKAAKPKKEKVKATKVAKEPKVAKIKKISKPVPANIYTLLFLFSWLALLAACVMLYMDIASYK